MADYLWIILAEVCKLKYSIKKLGENPGIMHGLHSWWNLNSKEKVNGIFLSKTQIMFCSLWSTFFGPQNARFQELLPPWTSYCPQPNFLGTSYYKKLWNPWYINKYKNLIQTSTFKFSFRGLLLWFQSYAIVFWSWRWEHACQMNTFHFYLYIFFENINVHSGFGFKWLV